MRLPPYRFPFLFTYSQCVFVCALLTHPPFSCPILLDSLRVEWFSSPNCLVVCAHVSVPSHNNISILTPPLCLFFFFIIELKCGSFHCKQCQESVLDTLPANTHICTHTHMSNIRLQHLKTLGKLDQDNTLTDFVYLPSSLLCFLHKACLVDVCVSFCVYLHACMILRHASVQSRGPLKGFV